MKKRIVNCVRCGKEIIRSVTQPKNKVKCHTCQKEEKKAKTKNYENIGKGQWTTKSEIKFINRLSPEKARKYASGLAMREFWGDLDQYEVINACRERAGF